MDLMSVTTNYTSLQRKYTGFYTPRVRIFLEGSEIPEAVGFTDVSISLSTDSSATSASFDIIGEYDFKNTDFSKNGVSANLQIGARVALEIGYIVTERVFSGVIVALDYVFDGSDAPFISVECLDAKNLMMKRQVPALFEDTNIAGVASELMGEQPFNTYVEGNVIEAVAADIEQKMITICGQDDYNFLVGHAKDLGYEFFILQGKAYYRGIPTSGSTVMTLSPDWGIVSFRVALNSSPLFKTAVVAGQNRDDDSNITAEEELSGDFGPYADRMLDGTYKHHLDANLRDEQEAKDKAENLIEDARREYGQITCRCVGIPELGPGRFIEIEGLSPEANGTYYILSVSHTLNGSGFFTELKGRVDP